MSFTRHEFLKLLGLGAAGAASLSIPRLSAQPTASGRAASGLTLGVASYTFREFSLDETIEMTKRLNLKNIALKSMHMPLDASAADIKAAAKKVRDAGLSLYGAGVIYMKTADEVKQTFEYAKAADLEMIIGVPNHELLDLTNQMVKQYNIKVAIHNHGPGDKLYSSVNDVYAKIKDLDKRIGFCIDVGHVQRIGEDPAKMVEKYKDRLYDMHMKDVNRNDGEGTPLEVGRGLIDIPRLLKTLEKINYQGTVAFEYEKDGKDPIVGLAESVGYVRGILQVV
ncbi:Sugar phosphate isomerase/epimerase [Catalinimonas alkaloidigena]|uniref:Sugar phosphate isomerase/epimerase n=1 Tax=Catalinimonas alkaloidigena TaxID=1075417 RepID=A0A1G9PFG0_9BACT|nr:sugar phosphate isomerase/epimerase [Catalinimonas alkaloidigena]SDL97454.1 Sugar phosphate isomerase/epimerase [Catalinimonas alkaloidigena]